MIGIVVCERANTDAPRQVFAKYRVMPRAMVAASVNYAIFKAASETPSRRPDQLVLTTLAGSPA